MNQNKNQKGQKSKRDDFPESVKKLLRERAGHVCSKPDCRKTTIGPQRGGNKVINGGDAAHIHAASPNGKRRNDDMTPEQRRSYDNGIWLCKTHAWEIDHDEGYYTVDVLRAWKRGAEAAAAERLNQRIYSEKEVEAEVRAGISGWPSKKPILLGIERMHGAQAAALQALDPRFMVSTSYVASQVSIELNARNEPVVLQLQVTDKFKEIEGMYAAMRDWGKELRASTAQMRITGSPLIDELHSGRSGTLVVTQNGRSASMKLKFLQGPSQGAVERFNGGMTVGAKGASFVFDAFDGLLRFSIDMPLADATQSSVQLVTSVQFERWNEIDIRRLPYRADMQEFFESITDDTTLECSISVEGREVTRLKASMMGETAIFQGGLTLLRYIESAAVVAEFLGLEIPYEMPTEGISADDAKNLHEHALIAKGKWRAKPQPMTCELQVPDDIKAFREAMGGNKPSGSFRFVATDRQSIVLFGRTVTLPKCAMVYTRSRAVLSKPINKIRASSSVKLTLVPEVGSEVTQEFVLADSTEGGI